MVVNRWKAFLFIVGGTVAAAGTAYVSGALDPYFNSRPGQLATVPQAGTTPKNERLVARGEQPAAAMNPAESPGLEAKGPVVPTFDVVRVEPNGEIVVAGKAEPGSTVEMIAGEEVVGTAKVNASGDFVMALDKPLKPGDHQLALRSTVPGAPAVTSLETAVVAIPEKPDGQVLAMVEKPGKASEVVIAPTPAPAAAGEPAGSLLQSDQPTNPAEPLTQPQARSSDKTSMEPLLLQPQTPAVAVQAVEIEGSKIFVAGTAEPGRIVRLYANDMLLGETKVEPNGRFLVEAERQLPVGSYTIRADVLGDDGKQVIARAAVPFGREPGEAIAAVAPDVSATAPAGQLQGRDAASSAMTETAKPSEQAAIPTEATAPKLEPVASRVIIRRGDTLWHISRRVYGHGIRYSTIYLANQDQIKNPDLIWPGQVFSVPHKTEQGENADMKAMGDRMNDRPASAAQ